MSEAVAGEYPVDGTDRREQLDPLELQALANGYRPTRQPPVIEIQPFPDDPRFDFGRVEAGHRPPRKDPGQGNG